MMAYSARGVNRVIRKISTIGIAVREDKQRYLTRIYDEITGVKRL
jgi:hypothetical protein